MSKHGQIGGDIFEMKEENLCIELNQAGLLVVPQTWLRSVGDRAFSSYAPRLWNALPLQIREAHNLSILSLT